MSTERTNGRDTASERQHSADHNADHNAAGQGKATRHKATQGDAGQDGTSHRDARQNAASQDRAGQGKASKGDVDRDPGGRDAGQHGVSEGAAAGTASSTTGTTTCVVVGGGPAGMVLGLLLARAGIDVTVLEKHGDFLRDFRGDTVHPTTLRLLDDLGLGEQFSKLPYSKVDRIEFPTSDGKSVVGADFRKLPGRYQYVAMVPQWDLLDMLATAGKAEPSFHLLMNTEATDTITEEGKVIGVRYRTQDGQTGELRADLTVAADGRWSTVRRAAGLRPREFPVPIDTWWFRLPRYATDSDVGMSMQVSGDDIGLAINRTEYLQVAYLGAKGIDAKLRAAGLDSFRARMARLLPLLADRVDSIESLDDVKHLDVRLNRLRTWYTDGLLCIGDAAHAMSPAGGVGINLAIQDAVAAATLLAKPLGKHSTTTADLAKVQRRRWPQTVAVQQVQRMLHRAVFEPVVTGHRTAMPPVLVMLLRRLPALRYLPAYLIGIGIRPEHAPQFARRVTVPMMKSIND